jgi:hypothetical protein
MATMNLGKIDTVGKPCGPGDTWPRWARITVTLIVLLHAWAIWAAAWAGEPASSLEFEVASAFRGYHDLIDQGYSYRFYAPEPPPTPVVTATIHYADGRSEEVRLPDRATRPRMLYQRELALANSLFMETGLAREGRFEPGQGPLAQSYARHLGKTHPGARSVTLAVQLHLIPPPSRVAELWRTGRKAPDLDAQEFYTVPERIGEYPCDAS